MKLLFKKSIILVDAPGQMCNRLWSAASWISYCNENNYYSTSGFFEIEIYIINGVVNQQIYTIFHGNDSDVRPTGIGYNYILPAGSSSTISLYKGNSLAWNAGSGPTIYAKSLKFGL